MISVCMATYNGERFLKQQIDSILCQLDGDDELIISDDGSTDSTLDIIKSYKNTRIKLLKHNKDKSLAETRSSSSRFVADNFQNALIHAKGDYIFLSDQDDVWYFNKKQKMLESLKNNDLVMCNFSVIDADNDIICEKYFKKSPISKHFIINYLIGGRFI